MKKKRIKQISSISLLSLMMLSIIMTQGISEEETTLIQLDDISITENENAETFLSLNTTENIGSFTIVLAWDPTIIEITDITVVDTSPFEIISYLNNTQGNANLVGYTLSENASGMISLAQITCHAVGDAGSTSSLTFGSCEVSSADPTPVSLPYTVLSGMVTITSSNNGDPPNNPPTIPNQNPIADLSAGEPYTGALEEDILFDGSNSRDTDGIISEWLWDLGDGTTKKGTTVVYQYSEQGSYEVTLTVTDNQGAIDTATTTAIIGQQNHPPDLQTINGPTEGTVMKNLSYVFTAQDPENDSIQYHINWGDGTNTQSEYLKNETSFQTAHAWDNPGHYNITVIAEDSQNATSEMLTLMIHIIDSMLYIDDAIVGYLNDTDNDGIYDFFYNNETAKEIAVEQQTDGSYLIDSNDDGKWDYRYHLQSGLQTYSDDDDSSENQTPGFTIVLVMFTLFILVIITKRR